MRESWKTLSVQINFSFHDEKQMLNYISHIVKTNVLGLPFQSLSEHMILSFVISFQ